MQPACEWDCTHSVHHIVIFCENDVTTRAAVLHQICQKLGDSQVETIQKIERVFSNDAMGITQVKGWYN